MSELTPSSTDSAKPVFDNRSMDIKVTDKDFSQLIISLLKGVMYRESEGKRWNQLLILQTRIKDYVSVLGLDLVIDEAEGYSFLRTRPQEDENKANESDDSDNSDNSGIGGAQETLLRLVSRRQLSFRVSLLLALLRKRLAEFDAYGGDTRLILSRDEIMDLVRVFIRDSSDEAKLADQLDSNINKVIELGFLHRVSTRGSKKNHTFEVRRILKAFVDGQWLADFENKLKEYLTELTQNSKLEPGQGEEKEFADE